MSLFQVLGAFLRRDFYHELSYRFAFAMEAFGILFSVVLWHFVGAFVQRPVEVAGMTVDYFPYVLIGIATMHYQHAALQGFAQSLRSEQLTGTLEALLVTPAPLGRLVLGSVQWGFVSASFRVLLYLVLGWAVFGMPLHLRGLPIFILALALMTLSAAAIGILSASFIIVFKRGDPLNYLLTAASTLMGGVFFPAATLPAWLAPLAQLLPVTHALGVMRGALLAGQDVAGALPGLAALAAFAAVLLPLALWVFGRAVDIARRNGTLVQY